MIRQWILAIGLTAGFTGCDIQPTEQDTSEMEIVFLGEENEINGDETPVYNAEQTFTFTDEDLWALYEPACLSNGIDPEICRCIMAAVIEAAGVNAAAWLASDMTLMEEQATDLLTQIGYEQAILAGNTFDAAQNGDCSGASQEPADTSEGAVSSSLEAVASDSAAIDNGDDE